MGRYDDYKRRVLQVSQRLSADGYFGSKSGSAGNVSMLVEGENAVVVTPTRLQYDVMTVEDICVVDFDLAPSRGRSQTVDRNSDARRDVPGARRRQRRHSYSSDLRERAQHTESSRSRRCSTKSRSLLAIPSTSCRMPCQARASCTTTSRASSPIDATATYFRTTARYASAPISTRPSRSSSCSKSPRTSIWMRSRPASRSLCCLKKPSRNFTPR